jgi:hypothetical protein
VKLSASTNIRYAGSAASDDTALRQLQRAVQDATNGTPEWKNLQSRAADDIARTRAELVCKQLTCNVNTANFPHAPPSGTALRLNGIVAAPPDGSLQPLALSNRGADNGVAPPVNNPPAAKPPDPNADCPDVLATIKLQKYARSLYANIKYVQQAVAKHEDANGYNADIIKMVQAWYNAGGADPSQGGSGSVGSGPTSNADTAEAIAGTDPSTCTVSVTMAGFRSPVAIRDAAIAHENVHAATCLSRP